MNIEREELSDIVALLDDSDSVVTECVDQRLKSFGPSVVRSLIYYFNSEKDEATRESVFSKADELNREFRLSDLEDFLKRRRGPLSLFDAGFIVCSLLDCTLLRSTFEDLFFKCSAQYLSEASDTRTAYENITVFNHIFYNRLGFTLYDVELSCREYSLLSDVLRSRNGNPYALAYIYLMVAQVCGLPMRALCFPGGFLPVYMENDKELFYVNVYKKGDIIIKDNLLKSIKVTGMTLSPDQFKIRDDRTIVGIYLESLSIVFSRGGENKKSAILERALDIIGPERFILQ